MQAAPGMLLRVELMLMEMRHPVVSSADAGRCIPCISAAAVHRRPARSRHRFMLSVHVFSLITLRSAAMPPRLQQFHWQPCSTSPPVYSMYFQSSSFHFGPTRLGLYLWWRLAAAISSHRTGVAVQSKRNTDKPIQPYTANYGGKV